MNTDRPNRMRSGASKRVVLFGLGVSLFLACALPARAFQPKYDDLSEFLEPHRVKAGVPALAAAVSSPAFYIGAAKEKIRGHEIF